MLELGQEGMMPQAGQENKTEASEQYLRPKGPGSLMESGSSAGKIEKPQKYDHLLGSGPGGLSGRRGLSGAARAQR